MPRKDRRFTGEDIRRLYCRNLTPEGRKLVDAMGLFCVDGGAGQFDRKNVAYALRVLSDIVSAAGIPAVPEALEILAKAVENAREEVILREMGLFGGPSA